MESEQHAVTGNIRHYDLLVIGSGVAAKVAWATAKKLGWKVVICEKGKAEGTCLNRGCIPSKILIHPADILRHMEHATRHLHLKCSQPTIDYAALINETRELIESKEAGARKSAPSRHPNVDWLPHKATFVGPKKVTCGPYTITADRVIIGTGALPAVPSIPGLADTPYMTSTEILFNPHKHESLIILGAGYIAVEMGHFQAAAGVKVTQLVRSKLLRVADKDIREEFERQYSRHVDLVHAQTERVEHDGTRFRVHTRTTGGEVRVLEAEGLLVATGVKPSTADLGLASAGVDTTAVAWSRLMSTCAPLPRACTHWGT
eukprot:gnl/Dysnectes_brevis/940_a1047_2779.p1 GENE.gnl/Dysnectes_brevis/940_a1047_2779~~gnl/Dysnectes_brevis/940_a1047_2779.p1  ORF type:complete len:318 (+),score=100.18 gnl/Dysnectes_brevis/940_a1047_2779:640-1593(+)